MLCVVSALSTCRRQPLERFVGEGLPRFFPCLPLRNKEVPLLCGKNAWGVHIIRHLDRNDHRITSVNQYYNIIFMATRPYKDIQDFFYMIIIIIIYKWIEA